MLVLGSFVVLTLTMEKRTRHRTRRALDEISNYDDVDYNKTLIRNDGENGTGRGCGQLYD